MGAYFRGEFIETCGGVDRQIMKGFKKKLIKGEKVILTFKHRPLEREVY